MMHTTASSFVAFQLHILKSGCEMEAIHSARPCLCAHEALSSFPSNEEQKCRRLRRTLHIVMPLS